MTGPRPIPDTVVGPHDEIARTYLAGAQVIGTANMAAEHDDGRPGDLGDVADRAIALAEVLRDVAAGARTLAGAEHDAVTAQLLRDMHTLAGRAAALGEQVWTTHQRTTGPTR